MRCTLMTMRSVRSRSSRTSIQPAIVMFQAACGRTGWATRALFTVAVANPRPPRRSRAASGNARARRRASKRRHEQPAGRSSAATSAGSRSAVKYNDDPGDETDRQPRHEPARRDLGSKPFLQGAPRPRAARPAGRPDEFAAAPRCRVPRSCPFARPAPLRHRRPRSPLDRQGPVVAADDPGDKGNGTWSERIGRNSRSALRRPRSIGAILPCNGKNQMKWKSLAASEAKLVNVARVWAAPAPLPSASKSSVCVAVL